MKPYPTYQPEHHVYVDPDLVLRALMHACDVLLTETSIWRDGHCVLCGIADSGGEQADHEDDCAVGLARRAFYAGLGEQC